MYLPHPADDVINELPRLSDASGALVSRMIVLRFTRSWYGKEDKGLTDSLMKELPGILWWAIDGWRKLQERGALLATPIGNRQFPRYGRPGEPNRHVPARRVPNRARLLIARADLYAAYQEWCERHGRKKVEDEAGFGRNLRAALPELQDSAPRIDGKPVRHYVGVAVKHGGFD